MARTTKLPWLLFPLLLAAWPAGASTSIVLSLDDLARQATLVARVVPTSSSARWEEGRIVTRTKVRVDRVVAGEPAAEVEVRTLGGVVGEIGQAVEGEARLPAGAASIVFLSRREDGAFVVAGRSQGQLFVLQGAAKRAIVRSAAGGLLVPRARRVPEVATTSPAIAALDGQDLDAAEQAVVHAWERTHAK